MRERERERERDSVRERERDSVKVSERQKGERYGETHRERDTYIVIKR